MDYNKAALEMHETHKGKVGIVSKVEVATAMTCPPPTLPVCRTLAKIKENPRRRGTPSRQHGGRCLQRHRRAGLRYRPGSRSLPVSGGKAVLFKEFGGVDAFLICIDFTTLPAPVAACKAIAPTFGGIIWRISRAPSASRSKKRLSGLIFPCSTMTSTALPSVTAALINALRV